MAATKCSNAVRLLTILPYFIHIYVFVLFCSLSHVLAGIVCLVVLVLISLFRIPPIDHEVAGQMLKRGKVSIIAHRGAAADAPENTISAMRLSKKNGADGVEFDIAYTSDGVPILLHDYSVDRTTDGSGNICDLTWKHVQTLNAAHKNASSQGFEKIPTLEETAQACLNLGLKMYIDCKADAKRTASVMAALFKKYPDLYTEALVCSFYPQVIYMVRRADPNIVTALIHRPWFLCKNQDGSWQKDKPVWKRPFLYVLDVILAWGHKSFLWYLCGNSAYSLLKDSCCRQNATHYNALGMDVILWTVNDPVEKTYFTKALGLDIITDTLVDH